MYMEDKKNTKKKELSVFEKEIRNFPPEFKDKVLQKEKKIKKFVDQVKKIADNKIIGFYLWPKLKQNKDNQISFDFDEIYIYFLFDDFERPILNFNYHLFFQNKTSQYLEEEKKQNQDGSIIYEYSLKEDKDIKFVAQTISQLRENCYDSIYSDLEVIGQSMIYEDNRNFLSALKSIYLHKSMVLKKFEKYVVAYVGAGSWLRGEKSNDFDVFIIIDDTDVKRMPRLSVKEQLMGLIWQMSYEVAAITGIQIHIQVYLLTDFWDAVKDAHPVMFTFLRDGVPFYDRGIYNAWKELLKLGKIRPSQEAIDMHMNAGIQLIEHSKKVFKDMITNNIYWAVLNPSQAILMLMGYNPTTPKETINIFEEILFKKEKIITKQDFETLRDTVKLYKDVEHKKDLEVKGIDIDKLTNRANKFLEKIKILFENITKEKTQETVKLNYDELVIEIKTISGFEKINDTKKLFKKFTNEFVKTLKVPNFVEKSFDEILKNKKDLDQNKLTQTEVNKVIKQIRICLVEVKNIKQKGLLNIVKSQNKLLFTYNENQRAEVFKYENKIYLIKLDNNELSTLIKNNFEKSNKTPMDFTETENFEKIKFETSLIDKVKNFLKVKEIYL